MVGRISLSGGYENINTFQLTKIFIFKVIKKFTVNAESALKALPVLTVFPLKTTVAGIRNLLFHFDSQ